MTRLSYGYAGDRTYDVYYRHSNRVPLLGLLLGGIAGLAVGLVAAVAYAYAIIFIPLIYANLISCGVFGFVLGWVPARVMRQFKVRSVPVVLAAVAVIALVAYAFHWAVWLYALFNQHEHNLELLTILTNPSRTLRVIGMIYDKGTWGMSSGSQPTSGVFLGLVWLAELVAIFSIAIVVARRSQNDAPFCEACNEWCPPGQKVKTMPWGNAQELRQRMEAKDWAYLAAAGEKSASAAAWFAVIHHGCRICNRLHTLSAKSFVVSTDRKGQTTVKEKEIVMKLLVTPEDVEIVRGASVAAAAAIPDASPPAVFEEIGPPPEVQSSAASQQPVKEPDTLGL